jgi:hypothetical protein
MSLDRFRPHLDNLWTHFYDEETRAFTFSILRDLWKSLLIVLVLVVFFIVLRVIGAMGYSKSRLMVWDWVHYSSSTAALVYILINFLGKLVFPNWERRNAGK